MNLQGTEGSVTLKGLGSAARNVLAIMAVFTLVYYLTSFVGLPDRVDANTYAIHQNAMRLEVGDHTDTLILNQIKQLKCLLLLPAGISPLQANTRCEMEARNESHRPRG